MAPGEKLQLVKRLLNRNPAFSSDSYIAASSRRGPATGGGGGGGDGGGGDGDGGGGAKTDHGLQHAITEFDF